MLQFKYLYERFCDWCGREYIPGDPKFPNSNQFVCSRECQDICTEIQLEKAYNYIKGRYSKKNLSKRGEHYCVTYENYTGGARQKRRRCGKCLR